MTRYLDGEVLGRDSDGNLILWDADQCQAYNCGLGSGMSIEELADAMGGLYPHEIDRLESPNTVPDLAAAVAALDNSPEGLLDPATKFTCRLPHWLHTSLAAQSGPVVSAPYRSAISAGSGST